MSASVIWPFVGTLPALVAVMMYVSLSFSVKFVGDANESSVHPGLGVAAPAEHAPSAKTVSSDVIAAAILEAVVLIVVGSPYTTWICSPFCPLI